MELKGEVARIAGTLAATVMLAMSVPAARADGGSLRFWERRGVYELAVFTLPKPLTVGPVDVSVLVLDADTGEPLQGVAVTLELGQPGRSVAPIIQNASAGTTTNKLFHHAAFELDQPGSWNVHLRVSSAKGTANAKFILNLDDAPRRWESLWPWYSWPVVLIAVYAIHQMLVLRRSRACQHRLG